MPLGPMIEYVLVTVNTDGEVKDISSLVSDPAELLDVDGNLNESIYRVKGDERTLYMKWNSDKAEWQMVN